MKVKEIKIIFVGEDINYINSTNTIIDPNIKKYMVESTIKYDIESKLLKVISYFYTHKTNKNENLQQKALNSLYAVLYKDYKELYLSGIQEEIIKDETVNFLKVKVLSYTLTSNLNNKIVLVNVYGEIKILKVNKTGYLKITTFFKMNKKEFSDIDKLTQNILIEYTKENYSKIFKRSIEKGLLTI